MRQLIALFALLTLSVTAHASVLYDGSGGVPPSSQSLTYLTDPLFGAQATQTIVGGGVELDTRFDTGESAGYFNFDQNLDRASGYTLTFDVSVDEESHLSSNRAGFSVLLVSSDTKAVELGFWAGTNGSTGTIFQQNSDFSAHAAETSYETTTRRIYDLSVAGDSWTLTSGGSTILSGALVQYDANAHVIYATGNSIFLGDNTGSADALISLYRAEFTPEPATLALLAAGACGMLARRRHRPA